MARLKVVIGNVDIETDGSPESAKVVRDLMNGLLNLAFDAPEPEKPKRKPKQLKDGRGQFAIS